MSMYLVLPNTGLPKGTPVPDYPVVIAINGRPFEAKEKICIDMDNGLVKVDGVLDGVFQGSVVIELLWGIMKPV